MGKHERWGDGDLGGFVLVGLHMAGRPFDSREGIYFRILYRGGMPNIYPSFNIYLWSDNRPT